MQLRSSYAGLTALALLLTGCGNGTEPQPGPQVLAALAGANQTAEAGEAVADPLVVSVVQDGTPVAGVTVAWSVTAGGGSVSPASSTTSAVGTASTEWTLGPSAGVNTVQASAAGATSSPVTFSATGTAPPAPPPTTATIEVGDNVFDPSSQRIALGGTVTWTWVGSDTHNVTFTSGPNSATQLTGTFDRTFTTEGTFDYDCTRHAGMSGTIEVEEVQ